MIINSARLLSADLIGLTPAEYYFGIAKNQDAAFGVFRDYFLGYTDEKTAALAIQSQYEEYWYEESPQTLTDGERVRDHAEIYKNFSKTLYRVLAEYVKTVNADPESFGFVVERQGRRFYALSGALTQIAGYNPVKAVSSYQARALEEKGRIAFQSNARKLYALDLLKGLPKMTPSAIRKALKDVQFLQGLTREERDELRPYSAHNSTFAGLDAILRDIAERP